MVWILAAFTACFGTTASETCIHTAMRHDAPYVLMYASGAHCEYGAQVRASMLGAQASEGEVTRVEALCVQIPEFAGHTEKTTPFTSHTASDE